jgi:hypothetical protein
MWQTSLTAIGAGQTTGWPGGRRWMLPPRARHVRRLGLCLILG